jgi:hypothetical protein
MEKRKNKFDAVRMMRRIRDEMSEEIAGMSFEEQKRYLQDGEKELRAGASGSEPIRKAG